MIVLGLTGSIGMGKSTTAKMFADAGIPVHDADKAVHHLYQGAAVETVGRAFPDSVRNGRVDRSVLARLVVGKPEAMRKLERLVHPMVRQSEQEFIRSVAESNRFVLLDIPLLFESRRDMDVDIVIVVSACPEIQKSRVMSRPNMTEEKFENLVATQIPDEQKRKRAHFIISTDHDLPSTRHQVDDVLRAIASVRA